MSGFDKSIQHVGAGLLAASAAWAQSATPINTPVQPSSPLQTNAVELVDALHHLAKQRRHLAQALLGAAAGLADLGRRIATRVLGAGAVRP